MPKASKTFVAVIVLALCCLGSMPSFAADIQIRVACEELTGIEVWKMRDDYETASGPTGCTRNCYFPTFIVNDEAHKRLNQEAYAHRNEPCDFIVGDTLFMTSKPSPLAPNVYIEWPNTIHSSYVYMNEREALDFAAKVCPNMPVKPGITVFPGPKKK